MVEPVLAPANGNGHSNGRSDLQVAFAIRMLRLRTGMSQRQLALRMQASTASACLRRLSDCVYSQSNCQAALRSFMVLYLFSPDVLWLLSEISADYYGFHAEFA